MIVVAIKDCLKGRTGVTILGSGGGIHNPILMQHLQNQLPGCGFVNMESLGINPDAKEAILFTILANETVCGNMSSEDALKGIPQVLMGKISFPN